MYEKETDPRSCCLLVVAFIRNIYGDSAVVLCICFLDGISVRYMRECIDVLYVPCGAL